ncbi:hypothetical protein DAEQUDRAFT_727148 [Daedalea quercina L-15889]|uniref:Nucleolus and neural progenitor protein-like N-terminal domain-containing protein n=1 Tax=Daedalea quercina L-15889 TaxID=1314783 RepID=A0A165Q3P5_9APHY|nr:hypothetical protein DAEQUDRAFT_727148 [Daedalea quercina L-15889]
MAARRVVPPPPVAYLPKASLDSAAQSDINSVLKQLKTCTRRLQTALASHALEMQVLERLYYKGKNQHRTALFWRNVTEIRRYGERMAGMGLYGLAERMRISFWGEAALQNTKLLKGSWSHSPDAKTVMFVMRRCSDACSLLQKARDRLSAAYHSFTLVMQTAAFLPLVLTLVAITSRLDLLLVEVQSSMEVAQTACRRLLQILDPEMADDSRHVIDHDFPRPRERTSIKMQAATERNTPDGTLPLLVDEDVGSILVRRSTTSVARASPEPKQDIVLPDDVSLLREDLNMVPTAIVRPTNSARESHLSPTSNIVVQTPVKRKAEGDTQQKKAKKRKKRDEIDDIFGL